MRIALMGSEPCSSQDARTHSRCKQFHVRNVNFRLTLSFLFYFYLFSFLLWFFYLFSFFTFLFVVHCGARSTMNEPLLFHPPKYGTTVKPQNDFEHRCSLTLYWHSCIVGVENEEKISFAVAWLRNSGFFFIFLYLRFDWRFSFFDLIGFWLICVRIWNEIRENHRNSMKGEWFKILKQRNDHIILEHVCDIKSFQSFSRCHPLEMFC